MKQFPVYFVFLICLCATWQTSGLYHGHNRGSYGNAHPEYDFTYAVRGNNYGPKFGHSESRDGYNTKGEYHVHLPDGRLQQVSYYVDEWGYHPTVTYQGKAQFPSHHKGYSPKGHRGYNRGYY